MRTTNRLLLHRVNCKRYVSARHGALKHISAGECSASIHPLLSIKDWPQNLLKGCGRINNVPRRIQTSFFIQTVSCPDDQEFSNFHNYVIDKTPRDQKWLRIRLDMIAKINVTWPLHLEIHSWSKAISIPVSLSLASLALTKEGKERNPGNTMSETVWNKKAISTGAREQWCNYPASRSLVFLLAEKWGRKEKVS